MKTLRILKGRTLSGFYCTILRSATACRGLSVESLKVLLGSLNLCLNQSQEETEEGR